MLEDIQKKIAEIRIIQEGLARELKGHRLYQYVDDTLELVHVILEMFSSGSVTVRMRLCDKCGKLLEEEHIQEVIPPTSNDTIRTIIYACVCGHLTGVAYDVGEKGKKVIKEIA